MEAATQGNTKTLVAITENFRRKLLIPDCDWLTGGISCLVANAPEMTQEDLTRQQVDQFILEEIDSVPHLEALLLLWNSRPKQWSADELSKALYLESDATQLILRDFQNRGFASSEANLSAYLSNSERDRLIDSLDRIYRHEIIRISTMIHSKASPAVRAFARAFRLKKD